MTDVPASPRWRILLTPRWLSWHLFAVVAVAGMIWLGDWQLRRALAGNTLSWAYTFEWPIFAIFGVVFWVKTIKDELRPALNGDYQAPDIVLPGGHDPARAGQPDFGRSGQSGQDDGDEAAVRDPDSRDDPADRELAEYNAYLARLSSEVRRHGRWHGLR
jgi:hypothetical protein